MALTEYLQKRNFKATPEPRGQKLPVKKNKERLMFVVQEHHASHLHYDFRLEWAGTLKSWSVPKGPSLDPHTKRLAVQVEDHPVEYGSFQGVIPENQYGAGWVYIWDTGTWSPIGDAESGFKKGKIEFEMAGKKLKGRWLLIRTRATASRASSKPQWLLMKRTDKFAQEGNVADTIEDLEENKQRKKPKKSSRKKASRPLEKKERKIHEELKLTHPDKILYPSEKLTKLDVAQYYMEVSDLMLPYVQSRPLTLVRCPEGAKKSCFYQKHLLSGSMPESIEAIEIKEKTRTHTYMSVDDAKGLTSLVQMGAFELHCWNSKKGQIESPDQIVMDFDPGPGVPWKKVVKSTFQFKEVLDSLGLKNFVKLSGGKGLHVHIPFRPAYTWEQVKEFSKALALYLQKTDPQFYLTKMTKALRQKKLFVDYLRNTRGATAVVPYSLRAKEISSVAMPLSWQELKEIDGPQAFSLTEALAYLKKRQEDPWSDYFHELQELPHLKVQG